LKAGANGLVVRAWLPWLVFGCGITAMVAALVLGLSSASLACFRLEETDEISINEGRAEPILKAIARYQQDHNGQFPGQLQVLVPGYIDEVPVSFGGSHFEYWPSDIDGYLLCFDLITRRNHSCCYLQGHNTWDCSPGAE